MSTSNVRRTVEAAGRFGVTLRDLREAVRLADEQGFDDLSTIRTSGVAAFGGSPLALVIREAKPRERS